MRFGVLIKNLFVAFIIKKTNRIKHMVIATGIIIGITLIIIEAETGLVSEVIRSYINEN